mgnify:CR=1 FL=1
MGFQIIAALGQGLRMGHRTCDSACSFSHSKAMLHFYIHCPYNIKTVAENEIVHARDRAGGGILHRKHSEIRPPRLHIFKDLLPGRLKFRVKLPKEAQCRFMGEGPWHAWQTTLPFGGKGAAAALSNSRMGPPSCI